MTGILGAYRGDFGRVTYLDITRPIATHAHPHIHMLFKISGADRSMQVGNRAIGLHRSNWVLVNPWQRHFDIPEECEAPTQMLALYIEKGWCRQRMEWPAFAGSDCAITAGMRIRVDLLARMLGEGANVDGDWVEQMVSSIMREAARLALEDTSGHTAMDFRIRRALAALRVRTKGGPDFEAVARSVGMSRSRFFEQFRNSVGIAPNMYVDALLIERAISLLGEDKPIDDIAETLGFSAQSSFTRFFKERVGFPPSSLRQAPQFTQIVQ